MRVIPDFSRRSSDAELMDDLSTDRDELELTLRELETINKNLGGYRPTIDGVDLLLPEGVTECTMLDVGTGGGDVPLRLHDWCARRKVAVAIRGIDWSAATIDYARGRCAGSAGIDFDCTDLFDLADESVYDIVHAAMVLHHFNGTQATKALKKMFSLARWGVVINDLHRHPLAYYSIRALTAVFSESRLIRNDAPLSVMRGFVREDFQRLALEAGLPEPSVRWRWAFRWQVVFKK